MKSSPTSTKKKRPDKAERSSQSKKRSKNQDASGVLKDSCQAENRPFEKSIESLEIAEIQHFSKIPDFIDPTRSPYPIIVKSPSSIQCVDGWELIEQAKNQGETRLTCEIIHIQRDSEIEYALWKASVRTMPIGGRCIYPEEVRNTCRLFKMLDETTENPVIFSHGGARRGDDYTNCRENNIRHLLEDRLGKKPKTINKYLNHGQFIGDEASQNLIDARVNKGFFEAIQKDKQRLIDELTSEQKSHDEIVVAVSDRIISWLEKGQISEPAEIVIPQTNQDEPPAIEVQPQQNVVPPSSVKPIEHKHWSGNPSAALEKQPTEDEICQEFISVGRLLIEIAENRELTTQDRFQNLYAQIIYQSRLIQQLKHLLIQQSVNGEE
jgi:hypothetical protein